MTKAEILALLPDGKLDMLIAETLFNWKPITDKVEIDRLNCFVNRGQNWWMSDTGENRYYAPSFSGNMAEAWKVVERLQTFEFFLRIIAGRNGKWECSTSVEVGKLPDLAGNPSREIAHCFGLPVPEMICKMALIAMLGAE